MSLNAYGHLRELERQKTFTVTEAHLKLLANANVSWDDIAFGAPAIDPKNPYGNSDVLGDIAELVHPELCSNRDEVAAVAEQHQEELTRLHAGTAIALQIALQAGEFKAGTYRLIDWSRWELVSAGEAK